MECYSIFYAVKNPEIWVPDDKWDRYMFDGMYIEAQKGTPRLGGLLFSVSQKAEPPKTTSLWDRFLRLLTR